jgi:hypothetical protein
MQALKSSLWSEHVKLIIYRKLKGSPRVRRQARFKGWSDHMARLAASTLALRSSLVIGVCPRQAKHCFNG